VSDPGPGVEPSSERVESAIGRRHRAPGEAERRDEESAALVEYVLFDDAVRAPEY
jgi:hypothetical protein